MAKNSKPLHSALRWLMAAGSVGAFFGGWSLLAHAPNPYENESNASFTQPESEEQEVNPLPTARPTNAPRRIQPLPTSRAQTVPTVQPPLQSEPRAPLLQTQTRRQRSRLRTGSS